MPYVDSEKLSASVQISQDLHCLALRSLKTDTWATFDDLTFCYLKNTISERNPSVPSLLKMLLMTET